MIIIDDVNDSAPEPLNSTYTVNIMEETAQTINFNEDFGFHDKDLVIKTFLTYLKFIKDQNRSYFIIWMPRNLISRYISIYLIFVYYNISNQINHKVYNTK